MAVVSPEYVPSTQSTLCQAMQHQEHVVIRMHWRQTGKKVPAKVIQVASHEVDTDSDKDESSVATSG